MQTYSHFILTAVLATPLKYLHARYPLRLPPLRKEALLFGSIVPDLPLTMLGIVAIGRDLLSGAFSDPLLAAAAPGTPASEAMMERSLALRLFDDWFFNNPWVIAVHNLFHSPLLLAIFISVGYWLWRRGNPGGSLLFWLAWAAMLHTLIDIPLHVTDGPLLLFPLNWEWRYIAPISYWDPNYLGREWSIFEHGLIAVLLLYLGFTNRAWLGERLRRIK